MLTDPSLHADSSPCIQAGQPMTLPYFRPIYMFVFLSIGSLSTMHCSSYGPMSSPHDVWVRGKKLLRFPTPPEYNTSLMCLWFASCVV